MNKRINSFLALVLSLTTLSFAHSKVATGKIIDNNQLKDRAFKAASGPEVAARVRLLKEQSKDVRAALKVFENKGRRPKVEESSMLSGLYPRSKRMALATRCRDCGSFQKIKFSQDNTGGSYVELIWVPTLSLEYEWHGTAIGNLYDDYGNLIDQYVANIVIVMPDHNVYRWEVVYELPFRNGVPLEPLDEPGMYTNVDIGTPLAEQYLSKAIGTRSGGAKFAKIRWRGGWRAWFKCSAAWCGGAILGSIITCGALNWWNAEIAFAPCAITGSGIGCIGSAVGCSYGTLWD
jgi:hypothetical protein